MRLRTAQALLFGSDMIFEAVQVAKKSTSHAMVSSVATCILASALTLHAERDPAWYETSAQELLGGQLEVTLEDGTRCDLLTDTTAYEIEYAEDWKQSIGQAAPLRPRNGQEDRYRAPL